VSFMVADSSSIQ